MVKFDAESSKGFWNITTAFTFALQKILWHVHLLLGNDSEISSYTAAVVR
jgi:hypothetical protein